MFKVCTLTVFHGQMENLCVSTTVLYGRTARQRIYLTVLHGHGAHAHTWRTCLHWRRPHGCVSRAVWNWRIVRVCTSLLVWYLQIKRVRMPGTLWNDRTVHVLMKCAGSHWLTASDHRSHRIRWAQDARTHVMHNVACVHCSCFILTSIINKCSSHISLHVTCH